MRKLAGLLVLGIALLLTQAAGAATTRERVDLTGGVLPCPAHTYTVTSGAIISVMRENTDARGVTHFTVTERPDRVSLVDQNGTTYAMRGAIHHGGRNDEILTATHMLNIVGRGGVSDSIRLVERFRNGQLISRDFGTCDLP